MNAREDPVLPRRWIYDLEPESLDQSLASMGMPAYAANQVRGWLYRNREADIDKWTNISLDFRRRLAAEFSTALPEVRRESRDESGTRKVLLELHDGEKVEAVWIPVPGRTTLCVSTQVGCPVGCVFCATGSMGFRRNLSVGEIVAQVLVLLKFQADPRERVNIVFMGMGEPLLNPRATYAALAVLTGDPGMNIPPGHITLSTIGLLKPLEELESRFPGIKISLSLHAADSETREHLMPAAASRHSVDELLAYFARPRRHPVTFEYVLIRGVNTSLAHARRLAGRLRSIPGKVNLIPFNPVPGCEFSAPPAREEEAFLKVLVDAGLAVTIRRSRGGSIQSACGQLAVTSGVKS